MHGDVPVSAMNRRDLFKLAGKVGIVALAQQVPWAWLERAGLVSAYLAEAAALPQHYRVKEATSTLLDMSAGHAVTLPGGISIFSGDGTVQVEDTTDPQYLMGGATKALKITITPGAVSTRIKPMIALAANTHGDLRTLGFPYWIVPGSGSVAVGQVELADAGLANRFTWDFRAGIGVGAWMYGSNFAQITRGWRTTTFGTAAYGVTNFVNLRFDIQAATGSGPLTIVIGNVIKNFETRPQLMLVFDDQSDTHYTEAFAYMAARGLVGSIAYASKFAGGANTVTDANVNEMLAAGWSIHNHSDQHPVLTSQTAAFAKADALVCKNYLASKGWDRNTIYVMPGAASNQASWDGIAELGYTHNAVGDALSGYQDFNATYAGGPLGTQRVISRCSNRETTSAAALAYYRSRIAEAIATGQSLGFIFHSITNTAFNIAPAEFRLLIDDIYRLVRGGVADCVNLETYVRRFTNPRLRRAA